MNRTLTTYCVLAGACDTATGALLVGMPTTTLRLMGVTQSAEPTIFVRFVGAFVAAVGLTYWLALVATGRPGRPARIATTLELTALIRAVVGTFVGVAVWLGALDPRFLLVTGFDLGLAALQLKILRNE